MVSSRRTLLLTKSVRYRGTNRMSSRYRMMCMYRIGSRSGPGVAVSVVGPSVELGYNKCMIKCSVCGVRKRENRRTKCNRCRVGKEKWNKKNTISRRKHRRQVGNVCAKCGFIAVDLCQMDVHHIDHNHSNNDSTNLISLCANCHRLEHRVGLKSPPDNSLTSRSAEVPRAERRR